MALAAIALRAAPNPGSEALMLTLNPAHLAPRFSGLFRCVLLPTALCFAMLSHARPLHAATFLEFVDPHPVPGNQFGATVVPLSTGNVVITSPFDDAGGTDAGAVYLFNGATGALISTLRGSTSSDNIGSGTVTALSNGNYVVLSPNWHNGAIANAGAVTWGSGTIGVTGVVSAANSLVGSTASDQVGNSVIPLLNGNYVVQSPNWDNGAIANTGAVTWGSGTTGVSGAVSAANSLVGSTAGDQVGIYLATALSNGNYVVSSPFWDNGAIFDAGAATWGSGTTGVSGVVSAANSLIGSRANDQVGSYVIPISNGNYVVTSPNWDNGAIANTGAATWGSGTTGVTGVVSAANSLVGSTANDQVGGGGNVKVLSNGNYVVGSPNWDNGAIVNAGAATWGSGTTGVRGAVGATNSLVGSTASDRVAVGVTVLSNGNYVVISPNWDNGVIVDGGAATWGSGTTGVSGVVSVANSLVGSTASDQVGNSAIPLSNGNYVVQSPFWDNGAIANTGAATWGSGTTGVTGVVSAANSLVGSTADDKVSYGGTVGVTGLSNGNYVVLSERWHNGATADAGAVTWGSGTTGVSGVVSAANSLVGASSGEQLGFFGVTALSNGNYVVRDPAWYNGTIANAGAATWGSGTTGVSGVVSVANSLVGSTAGDQVGSYGVTALSNGNYVVQSPNWHNGAIVNAGAATWGSGTIGVSGVVSAANSLIGSTVGDQVGYDGLSGGVTALSNGNYVVSSPFWDNGTFTEAGAATWGSGTTGASGVVSAANSLVGAWWSTGLSSIVADDVNSTFIAPFVAEGAGRVRVGPPANAPVIVSLVDIPNDQGGWLRLTFNRATLDNANATPVLAAYSVWRHVPGTLAAETSKANPNAARGLGQDAPSTERLRAELPAGLDVREVEGRFYVTGPGSPRAGIAAAFPPGTWELVASVPAVQQAQYLAAVPTISNAAPNDFVVTAHTTTPSIWFISAVVSGQSVDNLAPPPPSPFTAAFVAGDTHLHWGVSAASDFGTFKLYRGSSADFVPASGNMIAATTDTGYADVGASGNYYKLSAVDVNGNESPFAALGPVGTLDVAGDVKLEFALAGVTPNPARGNRLMVDFTLPVADPARLELVDVAGRRVVDRAVGALGAGRHVVDLAAGRPLAPGIYLVKLTQGSRSRVARAAVVR
jgi:hypothetical protein